VYEFDDISLVAPELVLRCRGTTDCLEPHALRRDVDAQVNEVQSSERSATVAAGEWFERCAATTRGDVNDMVDRREALVIV
jgi:hypothetical protein